MRLRRFFAVFLAAMTFSSLSSGASAYEPSATSGIEATFLQGWLCRDWSEERWLQELSAAKGAGFGSVIIQSVCDMSYTQSDSSLSKQNPEALSLSSAYCLYPSKLDALSACQLTSVNNGDQLEYAFSAAKELDLRLWLGTVNDDRWWNYGWGIPEANSADSFYFADWCAENGELSADIATELWNRYGDEFSEQLAGFYYVNEIWNIDVACSGTDNGIYADLIGENIGTTVAAIEVLCPEKPLLISPFFNADISTSEQYGNFMADVIGGSGLRSCDVFAHQDGGGREYSTEIIVQWAEALKSAVGGRLHFWINNETFTPNYTSKPVEQLAQNVEATDSLAEAHIIFSWNHYYNALVNSSNQSYQEAYDDFVESRTVWGDINLDGTVNVDDSALLSAALLSQSTLSPRQNALADLCPDNNLTCVDALMLKRRLT